MSQLCFITTCKGRLAHLQQSLPAMAAQPGAACVVVDYSCPEQCGAWVEANYPHVRVVRVLDRPGFSVGEARNRGVVGVTAPWLCFVDADVVLDPAFSRIVLPALRPRTYYRPQPQVSELGGAVVCLRADFERMGGYDEVMLGWGREDLDLYDRFDLVGLACSAIDARLMTPLLHEDALRVRHHALKDKSFSESVNHVYSRVKLDLMRLSHVHPNRETRQRLYEQVQAMMRQAQESPAAQHFEFDYARLYLGTGWKATAQVRVVLEERTGNEGKD